MTPPKAALDAATDQMLAAMADIRRFGDEGVRATLPAVDAHAAALLEQFPGNEELAGRVLTVASGIILGLGEHKLPEKPEDVVLAVGHLLGLIGERVHREGAGR